MAVRMNCPLCLAKTRPFFTDKIRHLTYFLCPDCDLRFLDPNAHLNRDNEHARYKQHNNDVTDIGYQNFVKPLYDLIMSRIPANSQILDFGCGDGPVLSYLLAQQKYKTRLYDPFFHPDHSALDQTYDIIFATEVVEHFYSPANEFKKLKQLLNKDGQLALMTLLYSENIDFESWFYRADHTHVCFYSAKTMNWIKHHFHFHNCEIFGGRTIWLS